MRPPAYDSGWISISQGETIALTHNLGTTEVFVYAIGNASNVYEINQVYYGGEKGTNRGLYWHALEDTTITVHRKNADETWERVRVMLWKIPEP